MNIISYTLNALTYSLDPMSMNSG